MVRSLLFGLLLTVAANASPLAIADRDVLTLSALDLEDHLNTSSSEWESKIVAMGYALEPPAVNEEWLNFTPHENHTELIALAKRQSCYNTILVTDTTQNFVDWDVQMSPVVCAVGAMTINVMSGWSVTNTLQVSANVDFTWVKDKLKNTFGVNFSRSWTTSTSITTGGTIPDGYCGTMITKPLTTRRYGSVYKGCIGSLVKTGTFMADDKGTGSYNGVQWVSGAISVCRKRGSNPPLSRCQGGGNFI